MNLTPSEAASWFARAVPALSNVTDRELFVLPPFPAIPAAQAALRGTAIGWGGQDVHPEDSGAHTGDVSAPMLADLGCRFVEVGHSERRRDHREGNGWIAAKIRAARRWNLTPILCIGERRRTSFEDARAVITRQLRGAVGARGTADLDGLVVAYEPVWAIGVGAMAAEPEHIVAAHTAIREWLDRRGSRGARVIYGGSVDLANAAGIACLPGVDGLFVGRAALDPDTFVRIARVPLRNEEG